MRLRVILENRREAMLPADHLNALRGLLYRLLSLDDPAYADALHDQGEGEGPRALKLFTFSGLRAPRSRRSVTPDGRLLLRPGTVDWWISSPRDEFLAHEVNGLLTAKGALDIAGARHGSAVFARFEIAGIEAHPTPAFEHGTAAFTCLTPIVAAVPSPEGRPTPYYLRPKDGPAFSEAVRKNLLRKYALIHGAPPAQEDLTMTFDPDFLARSPHGGTQRVTVHGESIIGALAPFTLQGNPELLQTAWDAGLGSKNGCGLGMIEVGR